MPCRCVFDLPKLDFELQSLERDSAEPGFWDNPTLAQTKMRQANDLRTQIDTWRTLDRRVADAIELAELDDESLRLDLETEIADIEGTVEHLELEQLLSGPHDHSNAILTIHSGAGGVDSMDWAAMLQRMFLRWIERRDFKGEIIDTTWGEEAGIKSATITVNGRFAYGYLKAERGVHRLVRISPFDGNARRHTSFALVDVYPELDQVGEAEIDINPNDLRVDTFRASTAGGQHMQKNETAVRITHLPTGVVVQCQNERSQAQNRETAMKVLQSRLYQMRIEERENELNKLKGGAVDVNFGSQIRSYVLHPYQMVKDHRTNHETANTTAVLDGDIDGFIEAWLRSQLETLVE